MRGDPGDPGDSGLPRQGDWTGERRGSNRGRTGAALAVVGVRGWGLKIWKDLAELLRTDVRIRAGG